MPSDVLTDRVEQEIRAAVLVEREQTRLRRLSLDCKRRVLERLTGTNDSAEASLQSLEKRPQDVVGFGLDTHLNFNRSVVSCKVRDGAGRPGRFGGRPRAKIGRC